MRPKLEELKANLQRCAVAVFVGSCDSNCEERLNWSILQCRWRRYLDALILISVFLLHSGYFLRIPTRLSRDCSVFDVLHRAQPHALL
jgi:hypothetical protein